MVSIKKQILLVIAVILVILVLVAAVYGAYFLYELYLFNITFGGGSYPGPVIVPGTSAVIPLTPSNPRISPISGGGVYPGPVIIPPR